MKKIVNALLALGLATLVSCTAARKQPQAVDNGLSRYVQTARLHHVDDRQAQGSLWTENSVLLDGFLDLKARRVSDIVTIQVVETTSATSEATTETSKESTSSAETPSLFGLESLISELPGLLDTSRRADFEGDASTTRRSTLRTSITATVLESFPNGHLLIEGNREILINNERQIIIVRGIVRPADITPDNSVLSTKIAELEIEVRGKGVVTRAQKPGILFKLLSGIWPF